MKLNRFLILVCLILSLIFFNSSVPAMEKPKKVITKAQALKIVKNVYPSYKPEFVKMYKRQGRLYYEIATISVYGDEGDIHCCVDMINGDVYERYVDGRFIKLTPKKNAKKRSS